MNKERRKSITQLTSEIDCIQTQLSSEVQQIQQAVESILEEEQDAFDNMPESLQYSDKGEAVQEAINNLEYALNEFENWLGDISDKADEIYSYLEEAKA